MPNVEHHVDVDAARAHLRVCRAALLLMVLLLRGLT